MALLAKCPQVLLPPPTMVQTTHPLTRVPASTPMVMVGCVHICVYLCFLRTSFHPLHSFPDGSQSAAQFPSRAAEAVWPQWQGQQHAQSNAEQHPHAQGNQQDMFPVSATSPFSLFSSLSDTLNESPSLCVSYLIQDVLSMLEQPANFNSDDFEISIYPPFNE